MIKIELLPFFLILCCGVWLIDWGHANLLG